VGEGGDGGFGEEGFDVVLGFLEHGLAGCVTGPGGNSFDY
jgi:hypothetical protein